MRKGLALFMCALMLLCLLGCRQETAGAPNTKPVSPTEPTADAQPHQLVILYTNDVHNAYLRDADQGRLGYAAVAAYRDALERAGETVLLIDGGDAIQGEAVGMLSKGSYLVDMMNKTGYDLINIEVEK